MYAHTTPSRPPFWGAHSVAMQANGLSQPKHAGPRGAWCSAPCGHAQVSTGRGRSVAAQADRRQRAHVSGSGRTRARPSRVRVPFLMDISAACGRSVAAGAIPSAAREGGVRLWQRSHAVRAVVLRRWFGSLAAQSPIFIYHNNALGAFICPEPRENGCKFRPGCVYYRHYPPAACCRLKGRKGAIPSGLCFM